MQKSNIVTLAVVAAAAYFGYEKLLKPYLNKKNAKAESDKVVQDIEKRQQTEKAIADKIKKDTTAFYELESIHNPNSYMGKVAKIQSALGIEIDGKAGPITNAEYQKRFGLDRGFINRQNIDYYLQKVKREQFLFM